MNLDIGELTGAVHRLTDTVEKAETVMKALLAALQAGGITVDPATVAEIASLTVELVDSKDNLATVLTSIPPLPTP